MENRNQKETFVLLGAEGLSELSQLEVSWLREATPVEVVAWRNQVGDEKARAYARDMTGRPYFPVFVSSDAPAHVLEQARTHVRLLRFREPRGAAC
jgi:hypothetical protein